MTQQVTDIGGVLPEAVEFAKRLEVVREQEAPPNGWYPYGSLSNLWHLDRLLTGGNRDLGRLIDGRPVADIGAADGDMSYFLAHLGCEVEIVDNPPTNWNSLNGARLLGELLDLPVPVHEVNLDSQFRLPRSDYGLVLFLGILYHLQNPYYALAELSRRTRYMMISTRTAAQTADGTVRFGDAPVAYLVDPDESNGDPTNYWIFSVPGLRRLVRRAGWTIEDEVSVGCTDGTADPSTEDRDQRTFMLLRSIARG